MHHHIHMLLHKQGRCQFLHMRTGIILAPVHSLLRLGVIKPELIMYLLIYNVYN